MAHSDDEDIVVENSALYHHLKNTGYTDFEVISKKDFEAEDGKEEEVKQKNACKALADYFQNKIQRVSDGFNQAVNSGLANAFKTVAKANQESLQLIMEHVYNSKVLLDEDVTFLQNFTSESFVKGDEAGGQTSQKVLTSAACLSAYGIGKTLLPPFGLKSTFTEVTEASIIGITGGYIAYSSMQWLFSSIYNGLVLRGLTSFSEMLQILKEETSMIKKCLTMIQEAELVARGFMLPSIAVPTCRLELSRILPIQSPERQCPELRESVFCWMREAFKRHREATLCLLEACPLQEELDVPSIYLACAAMSEFGRLVELDPGTEEEKKLLLDESEHFSLSSLKAIFQLMALQRSEFLRRLTLCFLPESSPCATSPFSVLNTFRRISSIIQEVSDSSQETVEKLKKTYSYYKSMWTPRLNPETKRNEETSLPPYLKNLQVSVHSIGLHLQAALMRVNTIEEQIEKIGENPVEDFLHESEWTTELFTKFHEIRTELDASKSCLDDGEMVLNSSRIGKNSSSKLDLPLKIEIKPQTTAEADKEILIIGEKEPVIHDQVFEAYISNDDQPQEPWIDYEFPTEQDKEKRQKERESSARLFKELKNVLVAKAEEHRVREEKALGLTQESEEKQEEVNENIKIQPASREGLRLELNTIFQNGNAETTVQEEEEEMSTMSTEKDECSNYDRYNANDISNSDSGYSLSAKTLSAKAEIATGDNDPNDNSEYTSYDEPSEAQRKDLNGDHGDDANENDSSEYIAYDNTDDQKQMTCNGNQIYEEGAEEAVGSEESGESVSPSPDEYMTYEDGAVDEYEIDYSDGDYYLEDTEALDKRLESLFSRSQKLFASSVAQMAAERSRAMGLGEVTISGQGDKEEVFGDSDEPES